jgi:guanylate kinase
LDRRGFPIVISGPSGVGKTVICRRILAADPLVSYSVSVTTRSPRPGERNLEHYEFVSDRAFDELVGSGALAEWAVVHGHRYGTRRSAIDELTARGLDVVMDVDVQGGMSIRKAFPGSVLVFILPPSAEALEVRLRGRATDAEDVISTRLENAIEEQKWAPHYNHQVVNDDLDRAVDEVGKIIESERRRREGQGPADRG